MKKTLLSIFFIIPFLTSCSNDNALSWNTNLIEVYNRTLDDVEDFQELVSLETIGDSTVNKNLANVANNALLNIDKGIKQFSEAEIPSDAELCQQAAIEMLQSAKQQLNVGLQFTHFTEETSEAEVDQYADQYDRSSSITAKKVETFIAAQAKFAKSAGIND